MKLIEINLLQGLTDSPLAHLIDQHQCTCNAPRLEYARKGNLLSRTSVVVSMNYQNHHVRTRAAT